MSENVTVSVTPFRFLCSFKTSGWMHDAAQFCLGQKRPQTQQQASQQAQAQASRQLNQNGQRSKTVAHLRLS